MPMFLKITGIPPENAFELHKILKSEKVRGRMPINHPTRNDDPEQTLSPVYAHLLRSKMSEANGSYTMTLRVNVDATPSRVSSYEHGKRIMVSRKVVDAIFDALGIYPEEEHLAPSLNLAYDPDAEKEYKI